jgi:hypothetical protein
VVENENKEEGLSTLVMSKVSTLCEDLIEDDDISLDLDDHLEHLKPIVKEKKTRQRKIYDTNNICKSTRKRVKKTIFIMQNIKGINSNSGGFGDTAKHLFVKEAIREHKLDFIALLETGRSNFFIPFLTQLAAGYNFS